MDDLILKKWKEFLLEEGRTSQYDGSPIQKNGKTKKTNEEDRRKAIKRAAMQGLSSKDILVNTNDMSEEKKKKKKNCTPGNPVHKKSDGKFGKKTDAGSWSIDYGGSGNEPCSRGVLRKPGSNQQKVWTKADECGRRGKWKCGSKGEKRAPWLKEGIDAQKAFDNYLKEFLVDVIEEYEGYMKEEGELLGEQGDDLADVCRKKLGLMSLKDFLLVQQRMVSSSKGDLFKQKKA